MKNLLFSFVGLLLSASSAAQPSGYLGKTVFVNVNVASWPRGLDILNASDIPSLFDDASMSTQYEFNIQKVRTNRKGIILHYRFQRNKFGVSDADRFSTQAFDTLSPADRLDYTLLQFASPSEYGITHMHHIGFGWTYYSKEQVAPLGSFLELELGGIVMTSRFYDRDNSVIFTDYVNTTVAPYLNVNWMRQMVVVGGVLFRYGFGLTVNPRAIYRASQSFTSAELRFYSDDRLLNTDALEASFGATVFKLKTGISLFSF